MTTTGLVHFMHDKESGPWASKMAAPATVARLEQLLQACADVCVPLLLVGSRTRNCSSTFSNRP